MSHHLDPDVIEAGAKAAFRACTHDLFPFDHAPEGVQDNWRSAYLAVVAELIDRGILPRSTSSPEEGNRG